MTQGNLLVGPQVLEAVARSFEATEGGPWNLGDRLVAAIEAGHAEGGDARKGRPQSAAVVVADPRPGVSRRPDGLTVNIQVCEHPDAAGELRRVYDAVSQKLGFRTLEQQVGADVWQLKVILHTLGYFAAAEREAGGLALPHGWNLLVPGSPSPPDPRHLPELLADLAGPPGLLQLRPEPGHGLWVHEPGRRPALGR